MIYITKFKKQKYMIFVINTKNIRFFYNFTPKQKHYNL